MAGALANTFVGLFNLLPGLPLDGGRVVEAAVWRVTGDRDRGTLAAAWTGRVVAVGCVGLLLGLPLAQGRRPSTFAVVWTLLIAWFLWSGATGALRYARSRRTIATLDLSTVGRPAVGVAASTTLAQALQTAQQVGAEIVVVLGDDDGYPVAYVDPAAVSDVPPGRRETTDLMAVAVPVPPAAVVDTSIRGHDLTAAIVRASSPLVATRDSQVVAVIAPDDVAARLTGGLKPPRPEAPGHP
jgi:hypothetical protein